MSVIRIGTRIIDLRPAVGRSGGGGGIPPATEEFIIIETSPYTGALVDYCHQENGVAPDEKIKIETAP